VHLYKALILDESGDTAAAIQELKSNESLVLDKVGCKESLAELYVKVGDHAAAEPILMDLLAMNSENRKYYELLVTGRANQTETSILAWYDEMLEMYPRSNMI
jgi:predicted Zn-dependent protease